MRAGRAAEDLPAARVSVVVVNFNAGALLERAVRSVFASTLPVEVIVVDNASHDGSVSRLEDAFPGEGLRVVRHAENLGFARGVNAGLRVARSPFVALVNPDGAVRPDALERAVAALEAEPGAGLAGGLLLNPDGTEQAGCRRAVPTPGRAFVRAFGLGRVFPSDGGAPLRDFVQQNEPLPAGPVPVEAVSGAFMVARAEALPKVGLMDEGYFLHCEDLDWCVRFRDAGYEVLFVPGAVMTHDKGACGRDRPVRVLWHMHRGMLRFYGKFFRHRYPLPLLWLVAVGVWLRFAGLSALALLGRGRAART